MTQYAAFLLRLMMLGPGAIPLQGLGYCCLMCVLAAAAEPRSGEQVYRAICLNCHGELGVGSKKHGEPLVGDKSILELAKYIEKTMPENAPGTCSGPDAQRVAQYIHDTFYSPAAQARHRPARVELSRLTVRQYQNTVADLLGTFQAAKPEITAHGLRGEYFQAGRFEDHQRLIDRVDAKLEFDFGREPPPLENESADTKPTDDKPAEKEKTGKRPKSKAAFNPHEFSARWSGSLLAPATGEYEIVVRTEHSMQFWLNHDTVPLIDAHVKSGDQREYRASLRLLGGFAYPLRLEFTKSKQGTNNANEVNRPKQVEPASIALLWKPPRGMLEVVPERCLTPRRAGTVFVLQTPFPPDDRSVGYERGTSISKEWDQANTNAALEVVGHVMPRLERLAGASPQARRGPQAR